MKICTGCSKPKLAEDFSYSKSSWDKLQPKCRECHYEVVKAWKLAHPIRAKRSSRNAFIKYHYGIDVAEYTRLLNTQKGRCAICRQLPKRGKCFCVDHSHSSGQVRGLLCDKCNWGLGMYNDNSALLREAAKYLEDRN